jgi:polyisoprenoid-binding protein YceI
MENPTIDSNRHPTPDGTTERWEIDAVRSALTFSLRHIVIHRIDGRFDRWGGTVFIDREHPWLSSLTAWVDLASISTGDPERDAQVRSAEFLDVARFPRAELRSTAVDVLGSALTIEARLDLHGAVHDVEIDAEVSPVSVGADGRARARYRARAVVDRRSFNLRWNQDLDAGGVVVGDEVDIVGEVELVRSDVAPTSG